jgi:hypothetical protein
VLRRTPTIDEMYEQGPAGFLVSLVPQDPLITPETRVIAFGDGLAAHFVRRLAEMGFGHAFELFEQAVVPSGLESPIAIAQQFASAVGERDSDLGLALGRAEVCLITLGHSEVRYDTEARPATVEENRDAFETIEGLRSRHASGMKIVYIVSPLRQRGTSGDTSPLVANAASKAAMRAALDEFLSARPDEVNETYFYFPAYEIVTDFLRDPYLPDNRYIHEQYADLLVDLFARHYTTLPLGSEQSPLPTFPGDALRAVFNDLQDEVAELQAACDDRSLVIEELARDRDQQAQAAAERLAAIERLTRQFTGLTRERDEQAQAAADRLALLEMADRRARRRQSLARKVRGILPGAGSASRR